MLPERLILKIGNPFRGVATTRGEDTLVEIPR